jgi:Fic family protein
LLALHKDHFIRPVDDALLSYLYRLYDGKMRFILDAVTSIVTNLPPAASETLDMATAKTFLAQLALDRVKRELTRREGEILQAAIGLGLFTNAELARTLKVKPPNVTKYLNALMDRRFIYPHHREGRQIFYCASEDVRILQDFQDEVHRRLF